MLNWPEEKNHTISKNLANKKRFITDWKKIPESWVDTHLDTKLSLSNHSREEAGVEQVKSHAR